MSSLWWIRDCWSLFVSNISSVVTANDLFAHFREVGTVFDVFVPKNKSTGQIRGFAFVRCKIEWNARKAIKMLNRRNIRGRQSAC